MSATLSARVTTVLQAHRSFTRRYGWALAVFASQGPCPCTREMAEQGQLALDDLYAAGRLADMVGAARAQRRLLAVVARLSRDECFARLVRSR